MAAITTQRQRTITLPPVISFTEGIPNLAGIPVEVFRDAKGREMLHRYLLHRDYNTGSTMIHHILEPDPDDLHDHPWDLTTFIFHGGYIEHTPNGSHEWHAPTVLNRSAEWVHRLEPFGDAWTFIVTGPVRREWGYRTGDGWVPWRRYHGLPPAAHPRRTR